MRAIYPVLRVGAFTPDPALVLNLAYLQSLDTRQWFPFPPREKRPARGRTIGEIAGHAGLVQRCYRVAAAGDRDQLARFGPRCRLPRRQHRSAIERRPFECPERAVPDPRRGILDPRLNPLEPLRTGVEGHSLWRDVIWAIG